MHIKALAALGMFLALVSPATAGNFAFAVPGKPGLTLTINGYAGSAALFSQRAGRAEQYEGTPHYIVRVDEAILAKGRLDRWCVVGLTDSPNEVCDDNPRETRGTYLFALPTAPEEPEIAVNGTLACAVEHLTKAGYLAADTKVPAEEAIRRAALRFAAVQKDDPKLGPLTGKTLEAWCARFAALDPTAIAPIPPLLSRLNFGPDVALSEAREAVLALRFAEAVLAAETGYRLKAAPAIYISADAEWMADGYAERTSLPASERPGRVAQFAACNGGEANHGMMFMCTKARVFSGDWYGMGSRAQKAYALAHELFHVMQNELIGPAGNGCCNEAQTLARIGPTWLVEGAAEYIAYQVLIASGWKNFGSEMSHQIRQAEKSDLSAAQSETRGSFYSNPLGAAVGVAASYELAGNAGAQTLPRFWQALGKNTSWEQAFETAFGITPASFYAAGDRRVAEAVSPSHIVQCVQGALNHLGFNAGAVDGDLGRGTRTAFDAYRETHDPVIFRQWTLETVADAGAICLYLAREHDLDDASEAMALRLARQATFAAAIDADPAAVQSVAVVDSANKIVVEADNFGLTRKATGESELKAVRLPYITAKDGIGVCMTVAEGWIVTGLDGKPGRTNCIRVDPVLGTKGVLLPYKVERGTP